MTRVADVGGGFAVAVGRPRPAPEKTCIAVAEVGGGSAPAATSRPGSEETRIAVVGGGCHEPEEDL